MSNKELLQLRYKVIAIYPGMDCEVGTILNTFLGNGDLLIPMKIGGEQFKYPIRAEAASHLFKRLEWWEERKLEEMPEYVKSIMQEYSYGITVGRIVKAKEWVILCKTPYMIQARNREYHPSCFVPATLADYEQYINQKEKQ